MQTAHPSSGIVTANDSPPEPSPHHTFHVQRGAHAVAGIQYDTIPGNRHGTVADCPSLPQQSLSLWPALTFAVAGD